MATGPEHYQAAERCMSSVDDDSDLSMALLAEAQVHATLALAAATALTHFGELPGADCEAWLDAASGHPKPGPAESQDGPE